MKSVFLLFVLLLSANADYSPDTDQILLGETPTCPSGTAYDGSRCIDIQNDRANCGSVGNNCSRIRQDTNPDGYCLGGVCQSCTLQEAYDGTQCVRIIDNVNNCGTLGNVCPRDPSGGTFCISYECRLSCPDGYVSTGTRCIHVNQDEENCGTIGNRCADSSPRGAYVWCYDKKCNFVCESGTQNNGTDCVDTFSNPNNCGRLGNVCTARLNEIPICLEGGCRIRCTTGWTLAANNDRCYNASLAESCLEETTGVVNNCTSMPSPPGGTFLCTNGNCTLGCIDGYELSNGMCVEINRLERCDDPRYPCPSGETDCYSYGCYSGKCRKICQGSCSPVGDSCKNLQNDPSNCGRADNYCPSITNGDPVCSNGNCDIKCKSGFGLLQIDSDRKFCLDIMSDVSNCGSVEYQCPETALAIPSCNSGRCELNCKYGLEEDGITCIGCDGVPGSTLQLNSCGVCDSSEESCSEYWKDANNCGPDSLVCTGPVGSIPYCHGTQCSWTCPSGILKTETECRDVRSDLNNCGRVGNVCPTAKYGYTSCVDSKCRLQCKPPYSLSNGTCINTAVDVNNCGTPGNVCPGGNLKTAICKNSVCSFTCVPPLTKVGSLCLDTSPEVNSCDQRQLQCSTPVFGIPDCSTGQCDFTCPVYMTKRVGGCEACDGSLTSGKKPDSCGTCGGNDGTCRNVLSDPKNCGVPGNICPRDGSGLSVPLCNNGTCTLTCTSPLTRVKNQCVYIPIDSNTCDPKNIVCPSTPAFASAICPYTQCDFVCPSYLKKTDDGCQGCDGSLTSGKVTDICGICGGNNSTCVGCDGIRGSTKKIDACGVCGGNNSTCSGCDGVVNSGKRNDLCGVCGGNNSTCLGCDNVPKSGKKIDACGICGGNNSTCLGCDNVPKSGKKIDACGICGGNNSTCLGCDNVPGSGKKIDACGICGGNNSTCIGCDGKIASGKKTDACGVCGGNNSTCVGCDNVPRSGKKNDACGVCGGNNSTCLGCDGKIASGKKNDACGVCGGNNSTCLGCDGVPKSGKKIDACGACGGNNSTCVGCDNVPKSGKKLDSCGVCGGNNSTCLGCDNVPKSGKILDICGKCGGDGSSCTSIVFGANIPSGCKNAVKLDVIFFGPQYQNILKNCGTWCNYDVVCTNKRPNDFIFLANWDCEIVNYATIKNATVSYCVKTAYNHDSRVRGQQPGQDDTDDTPTYFLDFKDDCVRYASGADSTWFWIYMSIFLSLGSMLIIFVFYPFIVTKVQKDRQQ